MLQGLIIGWLSLAVAIMMPAMLLPEENEHIEPICLTIEQAQPKQLRNAVKLGCDGSVLELPLEEYLMGVVLAEMPSYFESEALKAQAVAARTFTMGKMKNSKHDDCDVCADSSCCQAWIDISIQSGLEQEKLNKIKDAVLQTQGEVLTYGGELIEALYFSCSGGMTESAVAVWGNDIPYLKSVISEGEEGAEPYSEEVTVSLQDFKQVVLQNNSNAKFWDEPSNWIGEISYTQGGGVNEVEIGGQKFRGTEVRQMFGLNSAMFSIEYTGGEIEFRVLGFGHRVGMSQYGANAMAEQGSGYQEILKHYYTDVEIEKK